MVRKRLTDAAAKAAHVAKRLDGTDLLDSAIDGAGIRNRRGRISVRRSIGATTAAKVTIPRVAVAVGREAYRQIRSYEGDPLDQPPPPLPGSEPLFPLTDGAQSFSQNAAAQMPSDAAISSRTVGHLIQERRQQSAFDAGCERSWSALLEHLASDRRRYVLEWSDGLDAVFWAETVGYWHRMIASAIDPGFNRPPHLQVEFHLGDLSDVDIVALARGSAPEVIVSGVLVLDDGVRIFANRDLATCDALRFDEIVASVNSQITTYCVITGGSPPPSGNWSLEAPTLDGR